MMLSSYDRELLDGRAGEAASFALRVILRLAEALEATELVSVEQAHIDACALMSASSVEFAEYLADRDGRVCVPTTTSMIGLDLDHWTAQGIPAEHASTGLRVADAYLRLGCIPTWTCAPYDGYLTPRFGQRIAWGESNAVVFANSLLGARTNRTADFLDICAAITGRVPKTGLYCSDNRRGRVLVDLREVSEVLSTAPSAWAALGHWIGSHVVSGVPVLDGAPPRVSRRAWKALCAAVASAGGIEMFHAVGHTPEAPTCEAAFAGHAPVDTLRVRPVDLENGWNDLHRAPEETPLDAVLFGCPHFGYADFEMLARRIDRLGARKAAGVDVVICTSATQRLLADRGGWLEPIERFGARIALDTCPFHAPLFPEARVLMTPSGKCAYYAYGELGVQVAFGTLAQCVDSAVAGRVKGGVPW